MSRIDWVAKALRDLKSDDYQTKSDALHFLEAEMDDARVLPALINTLLNDKDGTARWVAAGILTECCLEPDMAPIYMKALKDEDYGVRADVSKALLKIADPRSIPALIEALDEEEDYIRGPVSWALIKIGEPAIPQLKAAAQNPTSPIRQSAQGILDALIKKKISEELLSSLEQYSSLQPLAAPIIAEVGDTAAIPRLVSAMKVTAKHSFVPADEIARALRKLGVPPASCIPNLLASVAEGSSEHMLKYVKWALPKTGQEGIPYLLDAVMHPSDSVVPNLPAAALAKMGGDALPEITMRLLSGETPADSIGPLRQILGTILRCETSSSEVAEVIVSYFEEGREKAAEAARVFAIKGDDAIPQLIAEASNGPQGARIAAVASLATRAQKEFGGAANLRALARAVRLVKKGHDSEGGRFCEVELIRDTYFSCASRLSGGCGGAHANLQDPPPRFRKPPKFGKNAIAAQKKMAIGGGKQ
jgi:HEAT repeat protein